MTYLLSYTLFLPLIGAFILMVFGNEGKKESILNIKILALVTTCATFLISVALVVQFDYSVSEFQFIEDRKWVANLRFKRLISEILINSLLNKFIFSLLFIK